MNYTKNEKRFSFSQFVLWMLFTLFFVTGSIMDLSGQTMPAAQSIPYSQDFSVLTGSAPTFPAGWQAWQVSANAPSSTGRTAVPASDKGIAIGTGSSTGSGSYDYTGKIGFLSVANSDVALCLALNTTGKSNMKISFDAMTIRNLWDGVSATSGFQNGLVLQYRIGTGATLFANLAYLPAEYLTGSTVQTSGTTGVNPITGLNAFLPASCENQSIVQVRWIYRNVAGGTSGSRPSVALDNVSVNEVPVTFTSGWPKAETPTASGFTAKSKINTPGTTYFVVLASGADAPTSAQVKAGQDASGNAVAANEKGSITNTAGASEYVAAVTGLSGNTTYDVYFVAQGVSGMSLQSSPQKVSVTTVSSAAAPTIVNPTATSITTVDAALGGEITSDGGSAITERGTVWKTTTGVTIDDNKLSDGLTSTGIFSHSRTELPSKTQIFYKAYAINAEGTTLTNEANFFTRAVEPTTSVGAFAANSIIDNYTSVELSWTAATGADGYIILKRDGASAPGTAPSDLTYYSIGNVIGTGTVAAIVNSGATLSQVISGLTPGSQYTFRIYPYGYDGSNAATMNYVPIALSSFVSATLSIPAPTTYTWNQTGSASMATASNWTPARTTTYLNDILQINGGGSVVLTGLTSQTIGQFLISNNTSVELQSAAAATLSVSGTTGVDLDVQSGSTLSIAQATNAIVINLLTGSTGTIAGAISFNTAAHKLTAVDASAIAFQSGSTFTAGSAFIGNAFGTTGNNSIVFESSSSYILNGGSNPFGATAPASAVVFQTGSNYVHKSTGGPSFSNRTYANFELNEAAASITAAASNPVTMGNLTITSGALNLGVTNTTTINGSITVKEGAFLNLNPATAGTSNVSGNLVVDNGGKLTNATNSTLNAVNLTLQSSSAGTGTFVNNGTVNLSGTTTAQQYFGAARNWYVSSPVASATAPSSNITRYYEYVEPGNNEDLAITGSTAYWKGINAGFSMTPGKGYIAQVSAETTAQFSGVLNDNAQYPIAVSRTTAVGTKAGFNLVGNPYPAYIDWSLVIADEVNANIGTSFWYRTKNTGNAYTFTTHNGTSGLTVTGTANTEITKLIPPMQAFWVRRTNEGTASNELTLKKTMLAHRDQTNNKFKAPQSTEQPIIRLLVTNGINADETLIYFSTNAQNGFDTYDSPKMFNNQSSVPEIFTTAGNEKLVINGLNSVDEITKVPLGFVTSQAGNFTISASELKNFEASKEIVLLDKQTEKETILDEGASYQFNAEITIESIDRFSLLFRTPAGTTAFENPNLSNVRVYVNDDNQITIAAPENCKYSIFNIVGQLQNQGSITSKQTTINRNLQSGIYFVLISGNGNNVSTRLTIN